MEYRIYPLEDQSRLPELCTLFAKGLGETTPALWKWKHYTSNGQPEGLLLVAEAEDGTFAGMFAVQPVRYACGEEYVTVVQTDDVIIDPAHRGCGLIRKLYHDAWSLCEKRGDNGFISFCNEASYPIFRKYGSVDMGDIYARNTAKSLLPVYAQKNAAAWDGWQLALSDEMPEDLFYPRRTDGFTMEKNDAFMRWKFVDNPDGPFRWLAIRKDGQLLGWMVVQVTQGRLRRAVNIYDWALRDEVPDETLRRAVQLLKTHGNWVSLWGRYSGVVWQRWSRAGLTQQNEKGTHFLLQAFAGQTLPENWHLTRADLDY